MTEPNKPLDQMTVQERLGLGVSYLGEGRFDEAIKALSSIHREEAAPETYAWAQFSLGAAYNESGKLDDAITAWSNIHRDDNPKTYAWAQFSLGAAYYAQEDWEQAIKTWSNISHDDDPETYAQAQLNLGNTYDDLGKLEQAIETWSNISHDDNPETYAWAQLNLGLAYKNQDELGQAIETWSNISHDDDPETYAWAQLNLGNTYAKSGELGQAIETWSNISHDDDPETYAWAQFNLGNTYAKSGELGQAITAWLKVRHDDDPETYAWAQFNLGVAYEDQGNLDKAITAWSNIHREDNPKAYARAQLNLGKIYAKSKKVKEAKEAYRNAREFFYYEGERGYRIHKCPPEVIKKLRDIAKNTDEVLKSLQIIPDFESQVAHYSRASTAFTLLEKKRKDQKPSHFRLSTIRGVNDPTEGLVLGKYWAQQGISETIHTNDTATFISCFTFNHDSLNQFRLYGKENGQEATGVSLVFKKEFFSDQADILDFIADPSTDPSSKSKQIKPNETGKPESDNKKPLIGKSTLYRCIYLDPETGYWTLAQRDKSTFYREHNENEDTDAKEKWEDYYELISEIEGCVETHLFNEENNEEEDVEKHLLNKENNDDNSVSNENNKIKSISQILNSIFTDKKHSYNKCNKNEKQKILEAIRFILLPLQYLVKHIAFQEEQECRIMYTTHLHDEKIHHDWKTQEMYVEYEEHVLPHIDKIYLSPGSAKYQDFFRILLDQKEDDEPDKKEDENESKVRISQNPFRNKE